MILRSNSLRQSNKPLNLRSVVKYQVITASYRNYFLLSIHGVETKLSWHLPFGMVNADIRTLTELIETFHPSFLIISIMILFKRSLAVWRTYTFDTASQQEEEYVFCKIFSSFYLNYLFPFTLKIGNLYWS